MSTKSTFIPAQVSCLTFTHSHTLMDALGYLSCKLKDDMQTGGAANQTTL